MSGLLRFVGVVGMTLVVAASTAPGILAQSEILTPGRKSPEFNNQRSEVIDQMPAHWFGKWTLNRTASIYHPGPPPFKRAVCRIEPWRDRVRVTYDMIRQRGGVTHLEWTGRLDGRDYSVEGVDRVVTSAYRRIDDRMLDTTTTVDGEIVEQARLTISPDGRTMTIVTTRRDEADATTTVYEKRSSF